MIAVDFWQRWVWPAGGSGGIPGDVVGTLVWVVIAGIVTAVLWPPLRHRIERGERELHAKLDHIIHHHPDIPEFPNKKPGT